MPKLELTPDESNTIAETINSEIKSMKRAQTSAKTPQIREVHLQHERYLTALQAKILTAK